MTSPRVTYLGPAYPDFTREPQLPVRELDIRTVDGIEVRLLWHAGDGRLSVAVSDAKTGEAFELEVPAGVRALDVFHHPYAYAADRRDAGGRLAPTGHQPS